MEDKRERTELERRLELAARPEYQGEKFSGGLIAGLIMAGFVLPMAILVAGWVLR